MIDLHTHSIYSDGTFTPKELIEEAERIGLKAIALSDHNTLSGLEDFVKAGEDSEVEAIPGIEISSEYEGTELHIVGLFIREQSYEQINKMLDVSKKRKVESNVKLVERLNADGYNISYDEIVGKSAGFINRANIARELVDKGYVNSVKEAFSKLLGEGDGYYVAPKRLDALDVISMLSEARAVPVLAHAFLNMDEEGLRVFLPKAKERGLRAMEVEYSLFDEETSKKARKLADEFSLMYSGGSDFHGKNKPDIQLGTGKGELFVDDDFLASLKELADIDIP